MNRGFSGSVGWLFELFWQLSGVDGKVRMLNHPLGLIRVNIRALSGCRRVSFHVRQVFCQRLSSKETSSLFL